MIERVRNRGVWMWHGRRDGMEMDGCDVGG